MNRKNVAHDLCGEVSMLSDAAIPRLVCDMLGDGKQPATVHIRNVEKMYVIANTRKPDETTTTPTNAPTTVETKEKKKKNRRKRSNRNK